MFRKKCIKVLIFVHLVITQIIFMNLSNFEVYAASEIFEMEQKTQQQTIILMNEENESALIGDVNGDGERNSVDYALIKAVLLGLRKEFPVSNGQWAADTNGDGVFNSIDYAYMKMFLLGYIHVFPAETVNVTPTAIVTPTLDPTHTPTPTPTETGGQDNEKPSTPKDFHYVTKTESSVTLAWDSSDENVSYDIYVDNSYYDTTRENSYTVSGLEKNTSYEFYVIAKDNSGNFSEPTEYIVVTTMDNVKTHSFKKITGGSVHTLALNEDGTVWAWGSNYLYCLGNDSEDNSAVPVRVDKLTDIVDISAREYCSLALRSDGTVWAWGDNTYSQCGVKYDYGVNSNNFKVLPTKVPELIGVEQICA